MDDQTVHVGERIRDLRKRAGFTLKTLGQAVGLSAPYLSQIENGQVDINIANLKAIGQALHVPVIAFFIDGDTSPISVTRRMERHWYKTGDRAAEALLVKRPGNLEICTMRLAPGAGSGASNSHPGEEFSFVLRGQVRVVLNDTQTYDLGEGDLVYYASQIPHSWLNLWPDEAEVLIVNTPATY